MRVGKKFKLYNVYNDEHSALYMVVLKKCWPFFFSFFKYDMQGNF